MRCPDEIAPALLNIIEHALLKMRAIGFSNGDVAKCAVESDHVHNLLKLVRDFTPEELKYYLEVSREEYRRSLRSEGEGEGVSLKGYWDDLDRYVAKHRKV
jgi:hypothetical protein